MTEQWVLQKKTSVATFEVKFLVEGDVAVRYNYASGMHLVPELKMTRDEAISSWYDLQSRGYAPPL